jgi:uncharacterized heparinase superfamily protein
MEPATMMQRVSRYFETARHLKPSQLAYWVARRTLGRSYKLSRGSTVYLRTGTTMSDPVQPRRILGVGNEFRFLNVTHQFPDGIDWTCSSVSKLWRYNLHYFDYALDPNRATEWIEAVVTDWIAQNPPSKTDGWEPYPVSLRVVNWIKFALTRCPGEVDDEKPWLLSLYQQLDWLDRNVEKEILANHLLKNAKALVMGGSFFAGPTADRWLKKGLLLLLREADEQFLEDGGHYERSLMYHSIAVEDILDVVNLSLASSNLLPDHAIEKLTKKCLAGLNFLEEICCPDGEIPLFNDAAFGIAPTVAELSDYGTRILGYSPLVHGSAPRLIDKPSTGYFGYRSGQDMLLVDAGPMGPSYQPGHGHCDLLSFELVLNGQRIIVDSGVFSYENDALRHILRSTAAHNTVRLDGEEQSDIWASFRVGRRARPGEILLDAQLPDRFYLRGTHDGYRHLPGRPIHERTFDCDVRQRWEITDRIKGEGNHQIESFLHIHPDIQVRSESGSFVLLNSSGELFCRIRGVGADVSLMPSYFCPEFGVKETGQTIRLSLDVELPAEFGFTIERV